MRWLFAWVLCVSASAARAESAEYEQRLVDRALETTRRAVEPNPEGQVVEEVLVASEDIFTPDDPWPGELNLLHRLSREAVVRREVLLDVGQPYRADLAKETERNLRDRYIFAVARAVAVRGQHGGVGLLVITRDRWSLRLNSDFAFVGTLLQFLQLHPTEQNFLGLDQQVALDFQLRLDTLQLGQAFTDNRVLDSKVGFSETAAVVLNRDTLAVEGSTGKVVAGRPLRSLDDAWALVGQGGWNVRTWRVYRGAAVWLLDGPDGPVPYVYEGRNVNGQLYLTRSFGHALKLNLSAGAGAYARSYRAPLSAPLSDAGRGFLEAGFLPPSESAAYLGAQARVYQADFRVLRNLDTFGLSEDFQLGGSALVWARWANPAFLSPSRFVEGGAWARYRLSSHGDLATVVVAAAARDMGGWVNKHWGAELSNYGPEWGPVRVVTRLYVELRQDDLDHRASLLGGSNGLRGAAPEAFAGQNQVLWNFELRSRAVEVRTVYVGGVLFWDAGSAFDAAPTLTHTVGGGLRILLPQFNHETIRIDFGWVVNGASPLSVDRFSGSYGQVTDDRPVFLAEP